MNHLSTILKTILLLAVITIATGFTASAQNNSRIAVSSSEDKTNIWITDFPKNSTVLLVDADKNLLSIISTNDFGSAYFGLNKVLKTTITARTMNGEIRVSNEIAKDAVKENETASLKTDSQGVKA